MEWAPRSRTMESYRTALMVNVSGLLPWLGLREIMESRGDTELVGDQGRWNCPGGRFWNGLGKRSGVET